MKRYGPIAIAAGLAGLTAAPVLAAPMLPGDIYLISRGRDGNFAGSHKVFQRESDGLRSVSYCGRNYWVRPVTVAWTQVEVENRHEVRVEFNFGKGWRPICDHPDRQVTLRDIGVTQDPRVVLHTNGRDLDSVNRFSAIRDSFHTGNDRQKTTFHDK